VWPEPLKEAAVSRTWEYNVLELGPSDTRMLREQLDVADEAGWELVSVFLAAADSSPVAVFRQPYTPAESAA
jgi:hypothetical protein